eukprot:scaffold32784_cov69-Phaeocystis_antarctica.AAC.2
MARVRVRASTWSGHSSHSVAIETDRGSMPVYLGLGVPPVEQVDEARAAPAAEREGVLRLALLSCVPRSAVSSATRVRLRDRGRGRVSIKVRGLGLPLRSAAHRVASHAVRLDVGPQSRRLLARAGAHLVRVRVRVRVRVGPGSGSGSGSESGLGLGLASAHDLIEADEGGHHRRQRCVGFGGGALACAP